MVKEANTGGLSKMKKTHWLISLLAFFIFVTFTDCGGSTVIKSNGLEIESNLETPYQSSVQVLDGDFNMVGSGTIIYNKANASMLILSAYHVVSEINSGIFISVPYDNIKRKVHIAKSDEDSDLVILQTDQKENSKGPYVNISKVRPKIGEQIWAIGNQKKEDRVLTNGIISKVQYKITMNQEATEYNLLYRITAVFYSGSSGGGVFNNKGELIGVISGLQLIPGQVGMITEDHDVKMIDDIFCLIPEPGAYLAIALDEIHFLIIE